MNDELYPIKGYESMYSITKDGRILSLKRKNVTRNRWLTLYKNFYGYYRTKLTYNGLGKDVFIHRLIASTFIPNPLGKNDVRHKNGIKTDNKIDNLEWIFKSDNDAYKYSHKHTGKLITRKRTARIQSKHEGVYWYERNNKWIAQVRRNMKQHHLGYFDNEELANDAVIKFKKEYNEKRNRLY